jgi:hypothetical protein
MDDSVMYKIDEIRAIMVEIMVENSRAIRQEWQSNFNQISAV